MLKLLNDYHTLLIGLHLLGVAIGLGGASASDFLFASFLRKGRLVSKDVAVLKIMSGFIWIGVFLLVISGFGLFINNPERYLASSKFLLKMTMVGVIIANGLVIHIFAFSKMVSISLEKGNKEFRFTKRLFAQGAISVISWYGAFVLGLSKYLPYSYLSLLLVYVGVMFMAIFISQLSLVIVPRVIFKVKPNIVN